MEFYPENLGEESLPLVGAMGVEYTVGHVRDMITELLGHLSETPEGEETGVTCTALVRLLAFILLEPVPQGVEELSECDRWSALRLLDRIRKQEKTTDTEKQHIYIIQFLMKGYECHACK